MPNSSVSAYTKSIRDSPDFSRLDAIVATAGMLLFSDAVVSWVVQLHNPASDVAEGNALYQAIAAACYLYAAVRLLGKWSELLPVLAALLPAITLVLLAAISTAWSDVPALTLRRSIALAGTTAFGLFVALRLGAVRGMWLLGISAILAATLSIIAAIAFPELGREAMGQHEGLWRGVFQQKNLLGRAMLLGILAAMAISERIPHRRATAAGIALACLICILGSGSTTALLLALCIPALAALISAIRLRPSIRWAAFTALGCIALTGVAVIGSEPEQLLVAIGKDPTLTGRTLIWYSAIERGLDTVWLGAGYKAFWLTDIGAGAAIAELLGWSIDTGHNSFLDLWLELGLFGLLLALLSLAVLVRDSLRTLKVARVAAARWALVFVGVTLLLSFSHTVIAVQNGIFWFMQIAFTVWIRRAWLRVGSANPSPL